MVVDVTASNERLEIRKNAEKKQHFTFVKNVGIYLVKRRQYGEGGGHKIGKMGRRRLWMAQNTWVKCPKF